MTYIRKIGEMRRSYVPAKHRDSFYESDLETAFIEWFNDNYGSHYEYLGRQVTIPAGRIDVLYYHKLSARPYIIEIKRGPTPSTTGAQLMSYMEYIRLIILNSFDLCLDGLTEPSIGMPHGIIVAKSLDYETRRLIESSNRIAFISYQKIGKRVFFDGNWLHNQVYRENISEDNKAMQTIIDNVKIAYSRAISRPEYAEDKAQQLEFET